MDLLVVSSNSSYIDPVVEAAGCSGCKVVDAIEVAELANKRTPNREFDVLVYVSHEIGKPDLTLMHELGNSFPKPILVLTEDTRESSINAAMRAGASSYVAGCSDLERLRSICQVASARFAQQRALLDELESTRNALKERKQIERAKGIIMKQRHIDEDEAYKAIRKLAMDTNTRVHDVAKQIINAAELLL